MKVSSLTCFSRRFRRTAFVDNSFSRVRPSAFDFCARVPFSALLATGLILAPMALPHARAQVVAPSPLNSNREATVVALSTDLVELNVGAEQGVKVGEEYAIARGTQNLGRVRISVVRAQTSDAQIIERAPEGTFLRAGDAVQLTLALAPVGPLSPLPPANASSTNASSTPAPTAAPAANASSTNVPSATSGDSSTASAGAAVSTNPPRQNRTSDYLAALAGLALVLSADASPSTDTEKAFVGDQQFSTISPFAGGGYSVRPDGDLRPGGAMHVNIPLAYTPRRVSVNVGAYALQTREGTSLRDQDGRNGTFNLGVGFPLRGRGVWLSRMALSDRGLNGGDRAYNALLQLTSETASIPAIAIGVQDATNSRERSPFVVATKATGHESDFRHAWRGTRPFRGRHDFWRHFLRAH
jgi:hypothetical protein